MTIIGINSDFFARELFSRSFADAKFVKDKTLLKWRKHSAVMLKLRILNLSKISSNVVRENMKSLHFFEFTVLYMYLILAY